VRVDLLSLRLQRQLALLAVVVNQAANLGALDAAREVSRSGAGEALGCTHRSELGVECALLFVGLSAESCNLVHGLEDRKKKRGGKKR